MQPSPMAEGLGRRFAVPKPSALFSGDQPAARFLRGSAWAVLGAATAQGLRLASFVLAARVLGKEGFGALGMLQSTVATAGIFAGLGLGLTATKHVAEFRRERPAAAGRVIGLTTLVAGLSGLLFAFGLGVFSGPICSQALNAPTLSPQLLLAMPLLVANTILGAGIGILGGLEAFRQIAMANTILGMLTFPAVVVGVHSAGLDGAVLGQGIAVVAGCGFTYWLLLAECRKQQIPIAWSWSAGEWRLLGRFSLPAANPGCDEVVSSRL